MSKTLKILILAIFLTISLGVCKAQQETVLLSTSQFQPHQRLYLAPLEGWVFKQGHNADWADPEFDTENWEKLNPTTLSTDFEDELGRTEGWYRIRFKLDESFDGMPLFLSRKLWAASDVYLNGELIHSFGNTGNPYEPYNPVLKYPQPLDLVPGSEYLLAIHVVNYESTFTQRELRLKPKNLKSFINLTGPDYVNWVTRDYKQTHIYVTLSVSVSFLLFFLYWFLVYLNPNQKVFRIIAWFTTSTLIGSFVLFGDTFFEISYPLEKIRFVLGISFQAIMTMFGLFVLEWVLTNKISSISWTFLFLLLLLNIPAHIFSISQPFAIVFIAMLLYFGRKFFAYRHEIAGAKWAIVAAVVVPTTAIIIQIVMHGYSLDLYNDYDKPLLSLQMLSPPLFYLAYISIRFRETLAAVRAESKKLLQVTEEKREILANQNTILETEVENRTTELKQSLEDLKSTQAQLIQSEKMASLGELTAGIAHEIQNPLNFVNNFSEVSQELLDEMAEEIENGDLEEVKELSNDIKGNLEKINHHGKRADAIVKGMLAHSRSGKGEKSLTDINALAEEYLKLSYHGLRAKDKSFNADFKTEFDPDLPKINVIPQDIGRVLLNLFNNAFQAVSADRVSPEASAVAQALAKEDKDYKPTVTIKTELTTNDQILISIKDNGPGIPDSIKDKIFQPFFTTKPTGQGTGLGLSLSYDIIKAHGGEIHLESPEGKGLPAGQAGTTFIVSLPKSN